MQVALRASGRSTTLPTLQDSPGGTPLLTVIVPVYNEAATIEECLAKVIADRYEKQIIVVDDGSTDGTSVILPKWAEQGLTEVLTHAVNRGKGAAIRTALPHARGRFTLIQDADLEVDPGDYPRLMEPLLAGRTEVVYGSRYLRSDRADSRQWSLLRCGVAALNVCVHMLYGVRLTDEATCYKVFPTYLLKAMDLRCERFEFCPEVTAKACRMGLRIIEVPIRYSPRGGGAGKKLRWKDGLEALVSLGRWHHWTPPTHASGGCRSGAGHAWQGPSNRDSLTE